MNKLNIYKTPQEFLDFNRKYLEEKEVENNLILGLCLGLDDKTDSFPGFNFLSVTNNDFIEVVSVKTSSRVVISGNYNNDDAVRMLADFYIENNIRLSGVIGEKNVSEKFADAINLKQVNKRKLIVYGLNRTNDLPLSNGILQLTRLEDLDHVTTLKASFQRETFGNSIINFEDLKRDIENEIENEIKRESLYNWIDNKKIVSIAAIRRTTKNLAVIGHVYTADEFRGKGYGTSIVWALSNKILNNGFNTCVLFADKSNPVSNRIYSKIGYKLKTEFSDIYFDNS